MKEALLVKSDGTYEVLRYLKWTRYHWQYITGGPVSGTLSEWEMVSRSIGYDEIVPVRNILRLNGMCIWKGDHLERPVNKFATALQRVNYLPDSGEIRGNVLITGDHTYHNRTNRTDTNPTIRVNAHAYRGTGTIKTLGRRKIKLLIQRIELANRLGKYVYPMSEKELELSTEGTVQSKYHSAVVS